MSHLNLGELQKRLRDALDDPVVASALLEQLTPIFVLGDLTAPENIGPLSVRRAAGVADDTGAAGERANVQLRNPANSGTLVVVERILVDTNTAGAVQVGVPDADADLGTVVATKVWRDSRPDGDPVATLSTTSSVGGENRTNFAVLAMAADDTRDVPLAFLLAPGSAIVLVSSTDAVNVRGTFLWREINE